MKTKTIVKDKTRFDARLSKEQKLFFIKAATMGGFRSLTDFILLAVQEKAKEIIRENENILSSQKDSEIFFDYIVNADKPNNKLISAAKKYKKSLSK